MDVGYLLQEARYRRGINQATLAERVGMHRSAISRFESGAVSPTVSVLARLLAACDLQVQAILEPLRADVDERVDAVLAGTVDLDTESLPNLVRTLEDHPDARHHPLPTFRCHREGPVTWAFDADTALQLQGLAFPRGPIAVAVVLDDAARWWLRGMSVDAILDGRSLDLLEAPFRQLAEGLALPCWTPMAYLLVRPVHELPATVRLAVPWHETPVPVLTVDAVEQAHPQHAELLARLRERRRAAG